jgi:hypothetical protein
VAGQGQQVGVIAHQGRPGRQRRRHQLVVPGSPGTTRGARAGLGRLPPA